MAGVITVILFLCWMVALVCGWLFGSVMFGSLFILSFLIASADVKTNLP